MFGIGTTELIIILIIVLIIFGVGKLPGIGSGLGQAIKNFKKSMSETEIDVTPEKTAEKEKLNSTASKAEEPAKKEEKQAS